MSTHYENQRAAIKAVLDAITGIGMVYDSPQNVTDEENFKTRFVKNSIVNTIWLARGSASDLESTKYAFKDGADVSEVTDQDENWILTFLYGYQETPPSEYDVKNLEDAIETAFRFLSPIIDSENVSPLQRTQSGIFAFLNNMVMCHKTVWNLKIKNLFTKS
jgi:hypothetical protein